MSSVRTTRASMETIQGRDIEIIVADGGSRDATRRLVSELVHADARIRLVDNPGRNTAAGLNVGIQQSRGSIVGSIIALSV